MLKSIKFIFIIYFIVKPSFPQQTDPSSYFPLTIPIIEIIDKDSTYTQSMWLTRRFPPTKSYRLDEYVYTLVLKIVVLGSESWNKPFVLFYELPKGEKEFMIINEEQYELLPDRFNDFLAEIHTKDKGWVKFELAMIDELTGEILIPVNSYPLRRRDFLLE